MFFYHFSEEELRQEWVKQQLRITQLENGGAYSGTHTSMLPSLSDHRVRYSSRSADEAQGWVVGQLVLALQFTQWSMPKIQQVTFMAEHTLL